MKNFDELYKQIDKYPVRRTAVAVAQDPTVIEAAAEAKRMNITESVLVGDEPQIKEIAEEKGIPLDDLHIDHEPNPLKAVDHAVRIVASGDADILMKGYIHTDDFLRGIVNKEHGLRTSSIMSHVFILEIKEQERLVFVSDGAMNINPDLEQKAAILLNAVYMAKLFGYSMPKVAVLAAVELVNPSMPSTVDAACLAKMADRRQYIPPCIVDGPLALDNAVSQIAAKHKKISGDVAGVADVLLVPNIESGNILVKSLVHLGSVRSIGLLVGAGAPVVLTSRADSTESKLLSLAGAVLMVNRIREFRLKIGKVHY